MTAKWFPTIRESRLNRASHVVFWLFGMLAGFVWQEHGRNRPVEAACAGLVLYFAALFVFDYIARRIVHRGLMGLKG